ncbi:hypothetical protein DYB25_002904, partial [Aphanomyces astaci]
MYQDFEDPRDADDAIKDMDGKEVMGERVRVQLARGGIRKGGKDDRGGSSRDDRRRSSDRDRSPRRNDSYERRDRDRSPPRREPARSASYKVRITGLSRRVDWRDVKSFVHKVGDVTFCDMDGDDAVVELATQRDLDDVVRKLDDTEFEGRRIRIRPVGSSSKRSRSPFETGRPMQSPIRVRRIRMTSAATEEDVVPTQQPEAHPLLRLPLEHLPWSLVPSRNKYAHRPRLRQGSAGGILDGILFLFGGFEDTGHRSNNLVQYDMRTHMWSDVDVYGKIPPPRYGHACALYEHEMWCFGGQGPEEGLNQKNIMGDLNILDLRTREWRRGVVSCAGVNGRVNFLPLPRRGHSIVIHDHSLYLYGGSGPDRMYGKDAYFGDLQVRVHDTMVVFGGQSSAKKHTMMEQLRQRPSKSLKEVAVDRKCLKIEFSPPDTGFASNTVHVLDVHRHHWTIPALAGTAPSARYGHVLTGHPQNPLVLFCFGGVTATGGYNDAAVHCLDLELQRWSTVTALEPIPPRTRHAMFAWESQ